ncbi:MAG: flagellar motor protein MotA [Rickettsiales bacterium]|nr:flagellar motor protein MotA [Rickettsiales bacterium]
MEILFDYFDKGGLIFLILLFFSVIALTIILYKSFEVFFFLKINLNKFNDDIDNSSNFEDLRSRIEYYSSSGSKNFMLSLINFLKKNSQKSIDKNEELNFFILKEFKKSEKFLPSLEIIAQVSPLIGLLGTVIGMIDSFNELELGGSLVDPSILAGGIWTALLTTAMGLVVAIPSLISHYFLEKKVLDVQTETESILLKIHRLN